MMSQKIDQLLELHSVFWNSAFKGYESKEIAETTLLELSELDSNDDQIMQGLHLNVTRVKGGWRLSWWVANSTAWEAMSMYDTLTAFLIQELHKEDYL